MKSIRLIAIGRESSSKSSLVSFLRACGGLTFLLLALFLFLAHPVLATAASDGAPDPTFNNFKGVQKIPYVYGQVDYVDTSGNATGVSLVYGFFNQVTDNTGSSPLIYNINAIAKLNNSNGTVDTSLNLPITGEVRTVWQMNNTDPNAPIIIGGQFSVAGSDNIPYYNLARLYWTGF